MGCVSKITHENKPTKPTKKVKRWESWCRYTPLGGTVPTNPRTYSTTNDAFTNPRSVVGWPTDSIRGIRWQETETLNHISTLMPDGWCNSKAQARSGMGNKVVPLPVQNQPDQEPETGVTSIGGVNQ